jgi:hypothetical protein
VAAHGHEVRVGGHLRQVEPGRSLDGVGVDRRLRRRPANGLDHGLDRLHDADLVVGGHDGDEGRVLGETRQGVEVDRARGVDGDGRPADSVDRLEDRLVLDRTARHRAGAGGVRAADGQVVGLGAAAREHDLVGTAPEDVSDLVAGLVDRLACTASYGVGAGGVAERLAEPREHRGAGLRAEGRRGCVV